MHVDFARVAGAEDVRADQPLRPRLGNGRLEEARALGKLATDVDVGLLHLVRPAGDHDPLDELVRILVDDVAVLERAGFGLVGVGDQVNGLAAPAVEQTPLDAAGEAGAAPAAQAGLLHLVDELLRLACNGFPQRLVAPVPEVAREIGSIAGLVDMAEDEAAFGGMRHGG